VKKLPFPAICGLFAVHPRELILEGYGTEAGQLDISRCYGLHPGKRLQFLQGTGGGSHKRWIKRAKHGGPDKFVDIISVTIRIQKERSKQ